MIQCFQAEEFVFKIDNSPTHANEEPIAATILHRLTGLQWLLIESSTTRYFTGKTGDLESCSSNRKTEFLSDFILRTPDGRGVKKCSVLFRRLELFPIEENPKVAVQRQASTQYPSENARLELLV